MAKRTAPDPSLIRVEQHLGSQAALARIVGKAQSTVNSWFVRGNKLPAEDVLKVEAATGISRHDLRPDLYPRDDTPSAQRSVGQPPDGSPLPPAGGPASGDGLEGLQA